MRDRGRKLKRVLCFCGCGLTAGAGQELKKAAGRAVMIFNL